MPVTREEVDEWWLKNLAFMVANGPEPGPDPRGKSPGYDYFYDYEKQIWTSR